MYQYDDATVVAGLPTPAVPGTPGYFTNGNPAIALPATILSADFMNMLMMENLNILIAAGITPSKTVYTQVRDAIDALIESRSGNYALDTGIANAYVIALSPTLTAYTNGLVIRFRATHANTGASTVNAGGGVVSLLNDAGSALLSGDVPLNSVVNAVYDSTAAAFLINSLVPSQAMSQTAADARYGQLAIANTWTQPQTVGNATASGHAINAGQLAAFALIQDVKANGINGGASVVGNQVRTLNTIQYNNITGLSLSANQITLPAGNYWIEAHVPCVAAGFVQAWLANVTDITIPLVGSSLDDPSNATSVSIIKGRISISATKAFQIVMYTSFAQATDGLGAAAFAGNNEIYTMIEITQLPV